MPILNYFPEGGQKIIFQKYANSHTNKIIHETASTDLQIYGYSYCKINEKTYIIDPFKYAEIIVLNEYGNVFIRKKLNAINNKLEDDIGLYPIFYKAQWQNTDVLVIGGGYQQTQKKTKLYLLNIETFNIEAEIDMTQRYWKPQIGIIDSHTAIVGYGGYSEDIQKLANDTTCIIKTNDGSSSTGFSTEEFKQNNNIGISLVTVKNNNKNIILSIGGIKKNNSDLKTPTSDILYSETGKGYYKETKLKLSESKGWVSSIYTKTGYLICAGGMIEKTTSKTTISKQIDIFDLRNRDIIKEQTIPSTMTLTTEHSQIIDGYNMGIHELDEKHILITEGLPKKRSDGSTYFCVLNYVTKQTILTGHFDKGNNITSANEVPIVQINDKTLGVFTKNKLETITFQTQATLLVTSGSTYQFDKLDLNKIQKAEKTKIITVIPEATGYIKYNSIPISGFCDENGEHKEISMGE